MARKSPVSYNNTSARGKYGPSRKVPLVEKVFTFKGVRIGRGEHKRFGFALMDIYDSVGRGRTINNQSVSVHPDAVARRERRAGGVYLSSKAPVQVKQVRATVTRYSSNWYK